MAAFLRPHPEKQWKIPGVSDTCPAPSLARLLALRAGLFAAIWEVFLYRTPGPQMTSSSDLASWPFRTKIIQLRERTCLLPLSHKPPPFYMLPSKSPLSCMTGGCTGGGGCHLGSTVRGGYR